jgi:hypothetical protein
MVLHEKETARVYITFTIHAALTSVRISVNRKAAPKVAITKKGEPNSVTRFYIFTFQVWVPRKTVVRTSKPQIRRNIALF